MKTAPNGYRSRFIIRSYRRISTAYCSYYMNGSVIGKGVVRNLSRTGFRVFGDHSLTAGTELCIRLAIGDADPPLEIPCASVRWVNNYEFGLRIEELTPQAAQRLVALVNADIGLRPRASK
ncbi:MAG TPA: PilZ domain-containing protein [Nitrospira sp.]|nr:PilZ domain-containing protein [Nitrospira sp.]